MPRLNNRKIKVAKEFCVERDLKQLSLENPNDIPCQIYPLLPEEKKVKGCGGVTQGKYKRKSKRGFVLHHPDRNPRNNPKDGSNWVIGCQSCNILDKPRGKNKYASRAHNSLKNKGEKKYLEKERDETGATGLEMLNDPQREAQRERRRYRRKKQMFRRMVETIIAEGQWEIKDLCASGAEVVKDVDVQTVERWLRPMISSRGKFTTYEDDLGETFVIRRGSEKEKQALLLLRKEETTSGQPKERAMMAL